MRSSARRRPARTVGQSAGSRHDQSSQVGRDDLQAGLFLSQSSSIFSRPISPYKRSSLSRAASGFGPRLFSNNAPALARISFFHCPTIIGCTSYSCAISLIVFTPRTASKTSWTLRRESSSFYFPPFAFIHFQTTA